MYQVETIADFSTYYQKPIDNSRDIPPFWKAKMSIIRETGNQ